MSLHEVADQLKHPFGTDAYKDVIGPKDHPLQQQTYQLRFRGQREEVGHPGRFAQPLSEECLNRAQLVVLRVIHRSVGITLIARIISGSRGGRTRQPAACVDPREESVYNVDTLKENFYGSCHP